MVLKDTHLLSQRFFGGLIMAGMLVLMLVIASPFYPNGPYHVLSFWGTGVIAFVTVVMLLLAHNYLPGPGGALDITAYTIAILSIGPFFGVEISPKVFYPPSFQPPTWILVFAFLVSAGLVDDIKRLPSWAIGEIVGLAWGMTFYGLQAAFTKSLIHYDVGSLSIIAFSTMLGGLLAGLLFQFIEDKKVLS
jgi:hypothetical protein